MELSVGSRVIAGIQIAGAAFGAFTLLTIVPNFNASMPNLGLFGILFLLCVVGFASGVMLLMGKVAGYIGSLVMHALQIPIVLSSAIAYKLVFGFGVFFGIVGPPQAVEFKLGAATILVLLPGEQPFGLALNAYAIIALTYLIQQRGVAASNASG